jgi:pyrimidine-specific ribonucleoside hydrolase
LDRHHSRQLPSCDRENAQVENAVTLYRRVLAHQRDHSVVIITTGFLTNLADLLQSPADSLDNRDGKQLVKQKVKKLVSMAGRFPQGKEFNLNKDSAASAYVGSYKFFEISLFLPIFDY